MFVPGNTALVSDQHSEMVAALRSLLKEMTRATPEERAIIKMSIDLLEYMHDYATGPTNDDGKSMTGTERAALAARENSRPESFTVDEFLEQLICSGGVELHDGRVVPRF